MAENQKFSFLSLIVYVMMERRQRFLKKKQLVMIWTHYQQEQQRLLLISIAGITALVYFLLIQRQTPHTKVFVVVGFLVISLLLVAYLLNISVRCTNPGGADNRCIVSYGKIPEPKSQTTRVNGIDLPLGTSREAQEGEPTCQVCLESISDVALDPCGHMFCADCMRIYSRNRMQCPFCKQVFTSGRRVIF